MANAKDGFKPNLYVIARFLDRLADDEKPWTRSSLQRACGVNYDIFRTYLELLKGKGFAKVAAGANAHVRLTPAGAEMRQQLRELLTEFMSARDGDLVRGKPAVAARPTRSSS